MNICGINPDINTLNNSDATLNEAHIRSKPGINPNKKQKNQ